MNFAKAMGPMVGTILAYLLTSAVGYGQAPGTAQQRSTVQVPQTRPAPGQAQTTLAAPNVVTRVQLNSGNVITFHEPEPGMLLVMEEGRAPTPPSLSNQILQRNESVVDLYRAINPGARTVPQALSDAQNRAASSSQRNPRDPEEQALSNEGPGTQSPVATQKAVDSLTIQPGAPQASTGEWFQKYLCESVGDFNWCWLYRTGTTYFQAWGYSMYPSVYSCKGTVTLKFEYKKLGDWKTYTNYDVLQGHYIKWYGKGSWRTRKSTVSGAANDCYHHAGWGSK